MYFSIGIETLGKHQRLLFRHLAVGQICELRKIEGRHSYGFFLAVVVSKKFQVDGLGFEFLRVEIYVGLFFDERSHKGEFLLEDSGSDCWVHFDLLLGRYCGGSLYPLYRDLKTRGDCYIDA